MMTIAHYPQPEASTPVSALCPGLRRLLAWSLLASWLLTGCASTGSDRPGGQWRDAQENDWPGTPSALANEVLIRAISLVGTPYRFGGNTPEGGFDCSGLVDYVFLDAAGLRLPRSTRELIEYQAPAIRDDRLWPGDLLFFNPGGGNASHIGIYVGEGRFVHAPSTGGTVRLDKLENDYWRRAYLGAKRVLR